MAPTINEKLIFFSILLFAPTVLADCGKEVDPPGARPSDSVVVLTDMKLEARRFVPPKPIDEMNRAERVAFVKVLTDSGAYRCCIDPGCTMCLYETDESCRCGDRVRVKDPVCGECFRGWKRGKGSVKGVEPAEVRRQ